MILLENQKTGHAKVSDVINLANHHYLYLIFDLLDFEIPLLSCFPSFKFKLNFSACCSLRNSSSNWEKNPVHQTQYFKLENVKNQVQIDTGIGCLLGPPEQ